MHASGYPAEPIIEETDGKRGVREKFNNDDDGDDDDEDEDDEDEEVDISLSDTEAVVGVGGRDSFDDRRSIASLSDDVSVLSTSASSTTTTSRVPGHSVLRRPVPLISTATFTSLSSGHGGRMSNPPLGSSSSSRHAGLSRMRRGSTSSRKSLADNSSKVSLILEDSASTSSKSSRTSKLMKKASSASLSSLASKAKASSTDLAKSSTSLNRRSHTNPLGLSKSRFSFLQRHSSAGSTPEIPNPVLTGGARQQLTHHLYKVLPSASDSQNAPHNGGGSSNSSSNSSSTSLSSTPTNSSANLSQQAIFLPSKPEHKIAMKSPADGKLSLDVRRLSISSQQGGPLSPFSSTPASITSSDKHKHHLKLRSRKEGHSGMILSSSSSNSKLTSDAGSIYSFNPASPAIAPYVPSALQKSISTIDVKNLSYKDINKISGDQALEEIWPFLCAPVMPLFAGEGLRVPVEDLNKLVLLHTKRRIAERDPSTLISEVKDMFKLGVSVFDNTSTLLSYSDVDIVNHVVNLWKFYHSTVLPYIEAVFLPLQLEFEGSGVIMTKDGAKKFWAKQKGQSVKMNSIKKMSLASFRDWIVLPLYARLKGMFLFISSTCICVLLLYSCALRSIRVFDHHNALSSTPVHALVGSHPV